MKSVDNNVIIKGNKYGIIVVLNPDISFNKLKEQIAIKFRESSKFFEDAKMALSFEGKELTNEEQREVLDIIEKNTNMHIVCIIDNDPKKEEIFKKSLEQKLMDLPVKECTQSHLPW